MKSLILSTNTETKKKKFILRIESKYFTMSM